MVDDVPQAPSSSAKARARDLALLEEDARRYLVRDRPISDALMRQLLKPRNEVLRAYAETQRVFREMILAPDGSLNLEGLRDPYGRSLGEGAPMIEAIAAAAVVKASLGDQQAFSIIADRVEGRATPRKLNEGEEGASRGELAAAIEQLVIEMNAQATRRPGDDAKVIDVKPNGHANGHDAE